MLYPNKKRDRPIITYDIQKGSVRHLFKTNIQTVIGFSALLNQVQTNSSIGFLELKTAQTPLNLRCFKRRSLRNLYPNFRLFHFFPA